jgi:signal transduction histidine kinase
VTELTAAFEDMARRVSKVMTDRSKMLAAIGHDLRSPITAMKLRLEFVDDDETRQRLSNCLTEIETLVQGALALARGSSTDEVMSDVSLRKLCEEITDELQETGADVRLDGEYDAVVPIRYTAMKRALRNVVENAVRYGTEARIHLADGGGNVLVQVDDIGPGIPAGERDRVFEPFVRLEGSRSLDTGGSGLGLAIAKAVVESHHGEITIGSSPQGGARVTVFIPL